MDCRAFVVYCNAWNKLLLVLCAAVVVVLAVQMLLVVSLLPLWLSVSGLVCYGVLRLVVGLVELGKVCMN